MSAGVFLPSTPEDLRHRGWKTLDIILVNGDAYIDSPFAGRALEARGFRVGVIAQPRLDDPADIRRLGAPIVLGGIEASLRRIAHYDFWSDTVRRSLLLDAKADALVYGMAEWTVRELAARLRDGRSWRELPGLCHAAAALPAGALELPAYEEVAAAAQRRGGAGGPSRLPGDDRNLPGQPGLAHGPTAGAAPRPPLGGAESANYGSSHCGIGACIRNRCRSSRPPPPRARGRRRSLSALHLDREAVVAEPHP